MEKETIPRMSLRESMRAAAYYAVNEHHCSPSAIQRKIGINYLTMSYVLDILERMEIITPFDGKRSERKVLINSIEELEGKLDILF